MDKNKSIEFLYEVVFVDSNLKETSALFWAKGFFEAEYLAKQAYAVEVDKGTLAIKSISVSETSFRDYVHNAIVG